MTPKEKAEDLVSKYYGHFTAHMSIAKKCALIPVDEVLFSLNAITDKYVELGMRTFWQEVRQEIENL